MSISEWFLVLTLVGIVLAAVEAFLPGGVAGTAAVISLLAASGLAFPAFGFKGGMTACILLMGGCMGFVIFWIRLIPRTKLGQTLILERNMEVQRSEPEYASLLGQEGVALSRLAPGGIARIAGARVDVLSDGIWIEPGAKVKVVKVSGRAITVKKLDAG